MNETPHGFRALVLRRVRNCPTCARDVTVHDDTCDECGGRLPKPSGAGVARPRPRLAVLPARSFTLRHAAAAMASLDVAVAFELN